MNAPAAMSEDEREALERTEEFSRHLPATTQERADLYTLAVALRRLTEAGADSSPAVGEAVADGWLYEASNGCEPEVWAEFADIGRHKPRPNERGVRNVRPLYLHPASPAAPGEVSERVRALVREWSERGCNRATMAVLHRCADELESALSGRGGKEKSDGRG